METAARLEGECKPKDIGEVVQDVYAGRTGQQAAEKTGNQTIHLDLSDVEIIKQRQRPKVTGKCVGDAYTQGEIRRAVEERCIRENVAVTELLTADDKCGGCSITYKGECSSYIGPEQALLNAIVSVDNSLKGEEALQDIRFQLKEAAHGRYMIEGAYLKTDRFPDSYFRKDVPRSELKLSEYWPIFGEESNFLALQERDTVSGRRKPDVIVRIFSALTKIARNGKDGYIHINPHITEPAFIKAITRVDPDMIYEELHTHVMLDGRLSVPQLVAIDVIKLPNRSTPEADPKQAEHTLPLLITKYIEGTTLENHIKASNLSERDTLILFAKVARAVGGIHDAGITHRDIKPRNILVTPKGDVFIVDYGTATESYDTPPDAGRLNITPYYCSPEHLVCSVDPRMDIFSLGASFSEILLGESPFHDLARQVEDCIREGKKERDEMLELVKKTPIDVARDLLTKLYATLKKEAYISKGGDGGQHLRMLSDDPKKRDELETKLQSTSEKTRDVIFRCMRGNLNDRYNDCYELATALDEAVDYLDSQFYDLVMQILDKDPLFGDDAKRDGRKRRGRANPYVKRPACTPAKDGGADDELATLLADTLALAQDAPDNRTDTASPAEDHGGNGGKGGRYRQVFGTLKSVQKGRRPRKQT
ncbi:MAG: protein kinase [Nanoarchaeota archaeon]|nr:protein kinase [Nanoarchaeota archaeon]